MKEYRIRALEAVLKKVRQLPRHNSIETWDYLLDDLARQVFELPTRPIGNKPYVSWLSSNPYGSNSNVTNSKDMQISQKGISLIKRWEGFRDKAYLCPAGVWTIGYGHTNTAVKGQCISKLQGETLLKDDLRRFEKAVSENVRVLISQGQYDALVSFSFNIGITAFSKSTLLRELNKKNYLGASEQFGRWVYANGKKLPGLIKRREDERLLFLS